MSRDDRQEESAFSQFLPPNLATIWQEVVQSGFCPTTANSRTLQSLIALDKDTALRLWGKMGVFAAQNPQEIPPALKTSPAFGVTVQQSVQVPETHSLFYIPCEVASLFGITETAITDQANEIFIREQDLQETKPAPKHRGRPRTHLRTPTTSDERAQQKRARVLARRKDKKVPTPA